MKKLFAFFLVLAISAGFTSVHAMIGSAPVHPVLTETEELTEEEQALKDKFDSITGVSTGIADNRNLSKDKKIRKNLNITLSNDAQIVYNNLNKPKFTVDDLIDLSLDDDALLSSLTELEIEGLVKAMPGGVYEVINH